jgi:tetratricopeptide (TPR) repeat protein
MRRFFIVGAVLSLLGGAAFHRVLQADFINFDDDLYVYDNPNVMAGLSSDGLAKAFSEPVGSIYQPLTLISLMVDAQWSGTDPFGYHLMNLLLHLINAWLLLYLLWRLTGSFWRSAMVSALFALHPLRVESVAWVTERKDVLSGLFFLLTLIAFRRWLVRPGAARYLVVVLLFCCGLLSKQILVSLPVVLLLLDLWPLGRHPGGVAIRPTDLHARSWGMLVWEKAPLFGLALASGILAICIVSGTGSAASLADLSLGDRLGNAVVSYGAYLRKWLWPSDLVIFYPHQGGILSGWEIAAVSAGLLGLTAGSLFVLRRVPALFVGWAWFCLMMLPMSGLAQAGSHAMADRFTYLPQIGLAVAVVWGLTEAARVWLNARFIRPVLAIGACVWLLALGLYSYEQTAHWKNSEAVFGHALACGVRHHFVYNNLGLAQLDRGALELADAAFARARTLDPENAKPVMNAGLVAQARGDRITARRWFEEAVRLDPGYGDAFTNLAISHYQFGDYHRAWNSVSRAVKAGARPHPGFLAALERKLSPSERMRALLAAMGL